MNVVLFIGCDLHLYEGFIKLSKYKVSNASDIINEEFR